MKFSRPRGTQDLFGDYMDKWSFIEKESMNVLRRYGYSEIRTPVFELSDLFVRTVGETSDIVTKEMYIFKDKKGRSLTLRPENTAPVMRAYIENGLHRSGGLTRFFYVGPMFRYDRPQAGRYRQFHQIGAEAIGSQRAEADAEIIQLSIDLYRSLGFGSLEVKLNSVGCHQCRGSFLELLKDELSKYSDDLCPDCSQRYDLNPLRVFDCKECGDIKRKLPVITDHLCEDCRTHFSDLRGLLAEIGISYELDPLLVRGLDYYTKTAFEIIHPGLGAQNALCGGGRYDGLAEELGGGQIPAVGFSAGLERLIQALPEDWKLPEKDLISVYFVVFDGDCSATAMKLAEELREVGHGVEVDLSMRNIKKQLKTASSRGSDFAVFIGEREIAERKAEVKNMKSGSQESVQFDKIDQYIRKEGTANLG